MPPGEESFFRPEGGEDLGFEGVTISDALDMGAIVDYFRLEDVVKYTIHAGVDMLLLPCVRGANNLRLCLEITDTAIRLVEEGEISAERIEEAVRRILRMKEKYGLLDQTDFSVTEERIASAREGVGGQEDMDIAWEIAKCSDTVLKK